MEQMQKIGLAILEELKLINKNIDSLSTKLDSVREEINNIKGEDSYNLTDLRKQFDFISNNIENQLSKIDMTIFKI